MTVPKASSQTNQAYHVNRWEDRQRLIDRGEAEALGISRRFLEIAAVKGNGPPFIKIGRLVRYRVGDLLDWIEGKKFTSTTEVSQSKAIQQCRKNG